VRSIIIAFNNGSFRWLYLRIMIDRQDVLFVGYKLSFDHFFIFIFEYEVNNLVVHWRFYHFIELFLKDNCLFIVVIFIVIIFNSILISNFSYVSVHYHCSFFLHYYRHSIDCQGSKDCSVEIDSRIIMMMIYSSLKSYLEIEMDDFDFDFWIDHFVY